MRTSRVLLIVAVSLVTLAGMGITLVVFLGWLVFQIPAVNEVPALPPLAQLHVSLTDGQPTEIHAHLAPGHTLAASVNLSPFDGFDPSMKPEEAQRRHGPPSGYWKVPPRQAPGFEGLFGSQHLDISAPYYDRPGGRVTLRPFPTPEQGTNWMPVAYPKDCTLEFLFPDERLRSQIERHLQPGTLTSLNVHTSDGWGALIVSLDSRGCRDAELMARGK